MLNGQRPGVIKIQIRWIRGKPVRIGQPSVLIHLGKTGDAQGLIDRSGYSLITEISGRCAPLAALTIHGHCQAPISLTFQGLKFTQTYRDRQAFLIADASLRGVGAAGVGALQRAPCHRGELCFQGSVIHRVGAF